MTALNAVRDSELFVILHVDEDTFDVACSEFERYGDQSITLVDHLSATLANERDIEHVFTFDDDFAMLGFARVPADIQIPIACCIFEISSWSVAFVPGISRTHEASTHDHGIRGSMKRPSAIPPRTGRSLPR